MRVAVLKIDGVESVDVSLTRAVADIRLRPGNKISLEQLRKLVKANGFTPREASVTAIGKPIERGGKPALELGPDSVLLIAADPVEPAVYKQIVGLLGTPTQALEIVGTVESKADAPDTVVAKSFRQR